MAKLKANYLPFFKFDALDWVKGKVQLLTNEEKGIYIELCTRIWCDKGKLKNDAFLHRKISTEKGTLSRALDLFLELDIIQEKGDYLSAKFLDKQITERLAYLATCSENGSKGGRPKKGAKPKKILESRNQKVESREEIEYVQEANILTPPVKILFIDFLSVSYSVKRVWPSDAVQRMWVEDILRWKDEEVMIDNLKKCIRWQCTSVRDCRELPDSKKPKNDDGFDINKPETFLSDEEQSNG